MIKVYIKKQSNYPVDTYKLKRRLREFLQSKGIVSDSVISIAIVGENKMKELSLKYLKETNVLHNVLSFVSAETREKFMFHPQQLLHLGDIAVCYPVVVSEAKTEQKLIDDKVYELVEHGALHLMGEHHE